MFSLNIGCQLKTFSILTRKRGGGINPLTKDSGVVSSCNSEIEKKQCAFSRAYSPSPTPNTSICILLSPTPALTRNCWTSRMKTGGPQM